MVTYSCSDATNTSKPKGRSWAFACKEALKDTLGSLDSIRIHNYRDVEQGRARGLYYTNEKGLGKFFGKTFQCDEELPAYMNYVAAPERWKLHFDARQWQLVYQAGCFQPYCEYLPPNMINRTSRWYVPAGQDAEKWIEMISSNFYTVPKSATLMKWYTDSVQALSKEGCLRWPPRKLIDNPDTIIYEFSSLECRGFSAQYEITRIARTASGILSLSYTKMDDAPSERDRSDWLKILTDAHVRTDEEIQPELTVAQNDPRAQRASFVAICSEHYKITPEMNNHPEGRARLATLRENRYINPDPVAEQCLRWATGTSVKVQ